MISYVHLGLYKLGFNQNSQIVNQKFWFFDELSHKLYPIVLADSINTKHVLVVKLSMGLSNSIGV